jgi:hypothetical protein
MRISAETFHETGLEFLTARRNERSDNSDRPAAGIQAKENGGAGMRKVKQAAT